MEVCALGRVDPSLPEAHGREAVPVSGLRAQLLALRPPRAAQEAPPAGLRQNSGAAAERVETGTFKTQLLSDSRLHFLQPVRGREADREAGREERTPAYIHQPTSMDRIWTVEENFFFRFD